MITKHEAMTEREFHAFHVCVRTVGPRGGVTHNPMIWRRNGQTQVWKTRPEAFSIPVKFGLYRAGRINQDNADLFCVASKCPVCNPAHDASFYADLNKL